MEHYRLWGRVISRHRIVKNETVEIHDGDIESAFLELCRRFDVQRPLQLPACCSVLSAEEMTYTEGGALSINITPEQVMAFGINATVNLLGMMGRYAFQAAVSGMQNALNDGLGVGDAIGHYWGKLNTWSKVATIGLAGLGGYYAYIQARSIYLSLKGFVTELKDAVDQYKADKQAAQEADQQNCLPTLVALC